MKSLLVSYICLALALAACEDGPYGPPDHAGDQGQGPGVGGGGGLPPGRVPSEHRAQALACKSARSNDEPTIAPETGSPVACRKNEECTAGVNGRCVGSSRQGWACSYDACADDIGCGTGVCECRDDQRGGANACLAQGDCHVDADCGAGGYCSPSSSWCGPSGVVGYYCHTSLDECTDDLDCAGADVPTGVSTPSCVYPPELGHWACSTSACAG